MPQINKDFGDFLFKIMKNFLKKYNIDSNAQFKTVKHCDALKLDAKDSMKKTDEGFLVGMAPVAKVGIMMYLMADGTVLRELVTPETLFNKDSMASFKFKPVTNDHPQDKKVTADTAWFRTVGSVGETIVEDSGQLKVSLSVLDGETIKAIENGKQELSPGYEAEIVFQKGIYNGDEYDAIQVSRKYNHLAIVDNARGGKTIKMNIDKCDGFIFDEKENNLKEVLVKYTIDGIEYEAAPEVVNHIKKLDSALATSQANEKVKNDEAIANKAKVDALQIKVDELEKRDIKADVAIAVKNRIALERKASEIIEKIDGIENLSDRDLKLKMIAAKAPKIVEKIDEKTTDLYIDTVLDTLDVVVVDALAEQRRVVDGTKIDTKEQKIDARQKMIEEQTNAWQKK